MRLKSKRFILIPGLFLFLFANSQVAFETFYPDNLWEFGGGIIELVSGNFILVGRDEVSGGEELIHMFKTNAFGDTLWTKSFNTELKYPYLRRNIVKDGEDCFLLSANLANDGNKAYFARFDTSANLLWEKIITSELSHNSAGIIRSSDNNYLVAYNNFANNRNFTPSLMKLDSHGNELWVKEYTPVDNPGIEIRDLFQDNNENIFLLGYTREIDVFSGQHRIVLIKTDASGNEIFCNYYGNSSSDEIGRRITPINDNEFIIWSSEGKNMQLLKLDNDGNKKDEKIILSPLNEGITDMVFREAIITDDKNIALLCIANAMKTVNNVTQLVNCNFFTLLNENYEIKQSWSNEYSTGIEYWIYEAMIQTNDGGFAFVGQCKNPEKNADYELCFGKSSSNFCFKPYDLKINASNDTLCPIENITLLAIGTEENVIWSNNEIGNTIIIDKGGTYFYTTDIEGCRNVASESYDIFERLPSASLGNDTTLFHGQSLKLNAYYQNALYEWNNGSNQPEITVNEEGLYSVKVYNSCGLANDSINVFYIDFPEIEISDIITPNGDGYNDNWIIKYLDLYNDIQISVWDNSGILVFNSDNYLQPWDGFYNGRLLESGAYYYCIVENNNGKKYTGSLAIYHK